MAKAQAKLTSQTLLSYVGPDGTIPAVLEGDNNSKIIPVIEGLVFPFFGGRRDTLAADGEFGQLIAALKRHLEAVL